MNSWFYIGVIPFPSPGEYPPPFPDSLRALSSLEEELKTISGSAIYTESRWGYTYRSEPIKLADKRHKKTEKKVEPSDGGAPCPMDPAWVQLVVGLASSGLAVAFYKVLKAWIEARAGRKIKLKFGKWEADFTGLNQRQVIKLFRELQNISTEKKSSKKSTSKQITGLLKELNIPAERIKKTSKKALAKGRGPKIKKLKK